MASDPFTDDEITQAALNRLQSSNGRLPPPGSQNGAQPTPTPIRPYGWNDGGNAQRLLDDGGRETLLYVKGDIFPWHIWDGNCWPLDKTQRVANWMKRVLFQAYVAVWNNGMPRATQTDEAKFLSNSNNIRNIEGALRSASLDISVESSVFDTHDWYLPCNNGLTYDMEAGKVIQSLPEHRMSRCVPFPALHEPQPHPKWDAVLNLVMGDDPNMVRYLRQLLGLCLTGYVGEKAFWFWHGDTNAGKTTILQFMARLGGPFVYSIPLKAILKMRHDVAILHEIAGIEGMRLVYAEEFKPGDVLDSSWVKRISGGNDITADKKGENGRTFRSTAKLVIGTNDMPDITDIDEAIRGRTRVVPFPANIPAVMEERGLPLQSIEEVVADLMTEAPAILYDLFQAVGEWRAMGRRLGQPEPVAKASKVYLDNQDPLIEWFEVCFEHDDEGKPTKHTVELPLEVWYWSFILQSGRADSKAFYQKFGKMLISKGFTKRAAYNGKRFTGPTLTHEARIEAESHVAELKFRAAMREERS